MSIQELSLKFKGLLGSTEFMLCVLIIIISCVSFFLGRMSTHTAQQASVQQASSMNTYETENNGSQHSSTVETTSTSSEEIVLTKTEYVGSKNGTKYHLPWCAGAKQIKEENKVWFSSKTEAEKAGYSPASNCKGI